MSKKGCWSSNLLVSLAAFNFYRSFYMRGHIFKVDFWINVRLFKALSLK